MFHIIHTFINCVDTTYVYIYIGDSEIQKQISEQDTETDLEQDTETDLEQDTKTDLEQDTETDIRTRYRNRSRTRYRNR